MFALFEPSERYETTIRGMTDAERPIIVKWERLGSPEEKTAVEAADTLSPGQPKELWMNDRLFNRW